MEGRGPFADHDVQLEIFHGRIQHFFDDGRKTVDLVDEQDVAGLQVGQQRGEIAGTLEHRPGSTLDGNAHFLGDDIRQGRLAQPRRTEDQRMVERLLAAARGMDEQLHLLAHAGLADVVGQLQRANGAVQLLIAFATGNGGYEAIRLDHRRHLDHALQGLADHFFAGQILSRYGCDGTTGFLWLEAEGDQRADCIGLGA